MACAKIKPSRELYFCNDDDFNLRSRSLFSQNQYNMSSTGTRNSILLNSLQPVTIDPPEFVGWRDYPSNNGSSNAFTTPPSLSARLRYLSSVLFSEEIDLHVVDFKSGSGNLWLCLV